MYRKNPDKVGYIVPAYHAACGWNCMVLYDCDLVVCCFGNCCLVFMDVVVFSKG